MHAVGICNQGDERADGLREQHHIVNDAFFVGSLSRV